MIDDWLRIPYVPFGRDVTGCDCWGLVRIIRKAIRGDELPIFAGVDPKSKRALTFAANRFFDSGFQESRRIRPGSIVCVWRGRICTHAAIVAEIGGRLAVIDTDEGRGVRWRWLPDFEHEHIKVTFHDSDD